MVFLDSNNVIYDVEQPPLWGPKASARLTELQAAGEQFAMTELVRMECLVDPLRVGDASRLADFAAFFAAAHVRLLPITTAVAERAAAYRGSYKFQGLDCLHLAAAVEHGCASFLTNDAPSAGCKDIPVEILK